MHQPLNRHQRREADKQARRAKPIEALHARALRKIRDTLAGQVLLEAVRPLEESETSALLIRTHCAFERVKSGAVERGDYDYLAKGIDIALIRALEIDPRLVATLERAQAALRDTRARYERTGRWGFDGPGLMAMVDALPVHEAIVNASSPMQIDHAADAALRIALVQRNMRALA